MYPFTPIILRRSGAQRIDTSFKPVSESHPDISLLYLEKKASPMTTVVQFPRYKEIEQLLTEHELQEKTRNLELKRDIADSIALFRRKHGFFPQKAFLPMLKLLEEHWEPSDILFALDPAFF